LSERISKALDLYPCELLFIHRDAESQSYDSRHEEIQRAMSEAAILCERPAVICVIPVRMHEAWLLFDTNAIRNAASNPSGRQTLQLPKLTTCESIPDPSKFCISSFAMQAAKKDVASQIYPFEGLCAE
jgi:hypothetical protein